jgi:hypothetical protein
MQRIKTRHRKQIKLIFQIEGRSRLYILKGKGPSAVKRSIVKTNCQS